ncbi:chalcone isomerase family protein [Desulfoluna sp.]|uniref:chalcone isomerase family protein n=1 Tax=Desulfoluna sp. TaxID=2045199 RepID=UPI0026350B97|nr:chalcone isomerase family protein [Desulfoluna sp.]
MFKRIVMVLLALCLATGTAFAVDAKDVKFPEQLKLENVELVFNGSGIRIKKIGFIKVKPYVAALFLQEKTEDGDAVVSGDAPMAIRLYITSKLISSDKMTKSTREGFELSTNGNTAPIEKEIDAMMDVFKEKINVDDIYDMVYVPGAGTCIYKQGEKKATIEGLAFKQALFGIWLGAKPTLETMKAGMLGQPKG